MRALVIALLVSSSAQAETILRMATAAPDGTSWAREVRAFSRDVEQGTRGQVKVKWYLGGIAGDELQMGERMKKDQLDGVASGAMLCERLSPSMRVFSSVGLFHNHAEALHVGTRLKAAFDEELARSGYRNLAQFVLGTNVFFTRGPVRSLEELRTQRLWVWDLDEFGPPVLAHMGVPYLKLPLESVTAAYDQSRVDGMIAAPMAALAFQWSSQTRYLIDLPFNVLTGCFLVANRAFDALSPEAQAVVRDAGARAAARLNALSRRDDDLLVGTLFAQQGMQVLSPNAKFRAEFLEAARAAREKIDPRLVDPSLLLKVTSWLADFRAANPRGR